MFCILNRETCTDEEWEITQEHAEESDMNTEDFLETITKVLEGHLRAMARQEQKNHKEMEAETGNSFVFSESMLDEFDKE